MQDRIKRALNGDAAAMKELFEANWREVAALCRITLPEEEEANRILEQSFKDSWSSLLKCNFDSEEAFRKYLLKHTAMLCRRRFLKNGEKSLPVPPNKNFVINGKLTVPYENASVTNTLAASMPGIQRFIFAMNRMVGMDAQSIVSVTGYKGNVLEKAISGEEQNLANLLSKIESKNGIKTDLDSEIERYKETLYLPEKYKETIFKEIDAITVPVRKKKSRMKIGIGLGALVFIVIVVFFCTSIFGGNKGETAESDVDAADVSSEETSGSESNSEASQVEEAYQAQITYYADIEIEDYGTVTVALDSGAAPATVENFVTLAQSGFYDGLTFHRIMDGFMMQGGDPLGNGTGGSEETVVGEFSENGYENPLSHTRGAISMARSSEYDSASSQFFIVQSDSTFLDGQYAAFGYVTEGMEIVDEICEKAEPTDDNGTIPAEDQPVITSITIREAEESTGDEE